MKVGDILRDMKVVGNNSLASVIAVKGDSCQACAFLDLESTGCTLNEGFGVDGFECVDKGFVWHVVEDKASKFDLFKDIDEMFSFENACNHFFVHKNGIDRDQSSIEITKSRLLSMKVILDLLNETKVMPISKVDYLALSVKG